MFSIVKIFKKVFLSLIPTKNIIMFESIPALSDNTKAVFDEMIRRNLNKKYKMVWIVSKKTKNLVKIKNVNYIKIDDKNGKKLYRKYILTAKCLVCCNDFLVPQKKNQTSFYLTHGTTLKSIRNYYNIPDKVNYCIATSNEIKDLMAYELNFDKNKIVGLGFPRNDLLTNKTINIKKILNTECKKIVVWYPTYRQHISQSNLACGNALPIIHNSEHAQDINNCAKNNDILLVLKPHFAQDLKYVKDLNLSNIRFIDDDFFTENNINSYEFVGNSDALITDYSSIYFDYLLCNKPIAVLWEDIEEYKQKPGLINNYEYYTKGAEKVFTISEFKNFLTNIANNVDNLAQEREEINKIVNFSNDGKNSERVVDFIIEKSAL